MITTLFILVLLLAFTQIDTAFWQGPITQAGARRHRTPDSNRAITINRQTAAAISRYSKHRIPVTADIARKQVGDIIGGGKWSARGSYQD